MTIFLRDHTQQAVVDALIAAGILADDGWGNIGPTSNYAYDPIGLIFKGTGEFQTIDDGMGNEFQQEIKVAVPGWHANILGPLSDEQRAILPIIPPPEPLTPERIFAE